MADNPYYGLRLGEDLHAETIREAYNCTRVRVFYPNVSVLLDMIQDPTRCNIFLEPNNIIVGIACW